MGGRAPNFATGVVAPLRCGNAKLWHFAKSNSSEISTPIAEVVSHLLGGIPPITTSPFNNISSSNIGGGGGDVLFRDISMMSDSCHHMTLQHHIMKTAKKMMNRTRTTITLKTSQRDDLRPSR